MWEEKAEGIGVGAGSNGSLNLRGQHIISAHSVKTARGCRARDAGRSDRFKAFKQALKQWLRMERRNGHAVDATDLLDQLCWCVQEAVEHGATMEASSQLTAQDRLKLMEYMHRFFQAR